LLTAVKRLRLPVLYVAARRDTSFAADARRLFRLTKGKDKRLVIVAGRDHGAEILDGAGAARARAALEAFLSRVTASA
jgi:pimeloyl-ACP methyl ester carboxylesterase